MSSKGEKNTNVRVCVRCRPLNSTEKGNGNKTTVKIDIKRGTVGVNNPDQSKGVPPKNFTFDIAFDWDSKQLDVYNATARDIVDSVCEGYNGTVLAYGQTGTGKTFTMEGVRDNPQLQGIIPNSFAHIFGIVKEAAGTTNFLVRVSYLEIYCEDCKDLLGKDQSKKLQVKESADTGVYVKDLTQVVCKNAGDMDKVMDMGNRNRSVGATKMNAQSSRSHAVFTVTIERSDMGADGKEAIRQGKLNLVDLAGSERQGKTEATGARLKEATKINLSLSALGNVISALVEAKKGKHVPYRDSKLTRLLMDSLGGNARTVMIANFGPADYNYDETVTTLRYADRAKQIKNKPKINENPKDAMLREMQEQIAALQSELGGDGEMDSSSEEEESEEELGDDGQPTGKKIKKKKAKKGGGKKGGLSVERQKRVEEKIAADKAEFAKMQKDKGKTDEELATVAAELKAREGAAAEAKKEREALEKKMAAVQARMIHGGENLLDKFEQQAELLKASEVEVEEVRKEQERLRAEIVHKEDEQVQIEEKFSTVEDEIAGKTKKMKKVFGMLMTARSEIEEMQKERAHQTETMLDNIRDLSRQLRLSMLVIDHYVPPEHQDQIEQRCQWNEEIGEWHIEGLQYTGNIMQQTATARAEIARTGMPLEATQSIHPPPPFELDLEREYLKYGSMVDEGRPPKPTRPKTGKAEGGKSEKDLERRRKKEAKAKKKAKEEEAFPTSRPSTAKARFA